MPKETATPAITRKSDSFLSSVGLVGLLAWLWLYFDNIFDFALWGVMLFLLWPGSYLGLLLMQKLNQRTGVFLPYSIRMLFIGVFISGLTAQSIVGFYVAPDNDSGNVSNNNSNETEQIETFDSNTDYKELWLSAKKNADQQAQLIQLTELKQRIQDKINTTTDLQLKKDLNQSIELIENFIVAKKSSHNTDKQPSDKKQKTIATDPEKPFDGLDGSQPQLTDVLDRLKNNGHSKNLVEQLAEILTTPGRAIASLLGFGGKNRTRAIKVSKDISKRGNIPNEQDLYILFAATESPMELRSELLEIANSALSRGVINKALHDEIKLLLDKIVNNTRKLPDYYVLEAISRIQTRGGCPIDEIIQYDFEDFPSEWTKYEQLGRIKDVNIRQCLDQIPVAAN
jgi:hypothetical protein